MFFYILCFPFLVCIFFYILMLIIMLYNCLVLLLYFVLYIFPLLYYIYATLQICYGLRLRRIIKYTSIQAKYFAADLASSLRGFWKYIPWLRNYYMVDACVFSMRFSLHNPVQHLFSFRSIIEFSLADWCQARFVGSLNVKR